MRKIRITSFHTNLAKQYLQEITHPECLTCVNCQSHYKNDKINPLCNLRNLYQNFVNNSITITSGYITLSQSERNAYITYIDIIITNFASIVTGTPTFLETVISTIFGTTLNVKRKLSINGNKEKEFSKILIEAMQYKEIRHSIMPKYIRQMGIKSCVYCNADYTITDESNTAFYQLDHWKAKSIYPYLSISFFNLQPCCASCNLHKSDDDKHEYFQLYADDDNEPLDVFQFKLKNGALANYLTDHKSEHLKPEWTSKFSSSDDIRKNMDKKLHITKRYAEHVDEIEELVWKSQFSRNSFIKALNKAKLGIKLTDGEVNRFILGTYSDAEDIHKRPLTKLKQDLGENLNLIPTPLQS